MRDLCGIDMFLYNPLTHRHVNLPPLSIPKHKFRKGQGCPVKLILSSPPDEDEDGKCRAVMFFGNEHRLAYCCPGRSKEWIPLGDLFHDNEGRIPWMYQDIIYSHTKQSLFCMTVCSDFESWDLRDPHSPIMNWKLLNHDMPLFAAADNRCPRCGKGNADRLKSSSFELFKYLVFDERSDRLFVVSRRVKIHRGPNGYHDYSFPYQTVGFVVDQIIVLPGGNDGEKKKELRRMDGNLDGMSFFIGAKGHGFVVVPNEDNYNGHVEPNCIYFTDSHQLTPRPWSKKKVSCGGHDIGIFNYENSTFSSCYYPRDLESARRMNPAPTWFTPSSSFLSSVA
ncbi:hypothetical protein MIMGU_mgv1a009626mg [Erythranthe guttata]|uniref:KIB1-4 beta-propeller domain-containing protein n=1 Tax=Erythranthe guttata TaxID=4155 RepID=A0A022QPH5_ERYGU|nr:hypothetical protein MIMGU_mgv1a009626mg [Erythranthe guttata]